MLYFHLFLFYLLIYCYFLYFICYCVFCYYTSLFSLCSFPRRGFFVSLCCWSLYLLSMLLILASLFIALYFLLSISLSSIDPCSMCSFLLFCLSHPLSLSPNFFFRLLSLLSLLLILTPFIAPPKFLFSLVCCYLTIFYIAKIVFRGSRRLYTRFFIPSLYLTIPWLF